MKKLAVLALAVLILPSVFAVIAQTHHVQMTSNLITQGYEFARITGFNYQDTPVDVLHWHLTAELGSSHAFCELQPLSVPAGPFDVDITVQCQTHSGFTTLFPSGTLVKIDTFYPDGTSENALKLNTIKIETRPQVPSAFPVSPIGHVILEEQSSTAGTLLFVGGIGAIVILTAAVLFFTMRRKE